MNVFHLSPRLLTPRFANGRCLWRYSEGMCLFSSLFLRAVVGVLLSNPLTTKRRTKPGKPNFHSPNNDKNLKLGILLKMNILWKKGIHNVLCCLPLCRILRFQSLAVSLPLTNWNSFGVSHSPRYLIEGPLLPWHSLLMYSKALFSPHSTSMHGSPLSKNGWKSGIEENLSSIKSSGWWWRCCCWWWWCSAESRSPKYARWWANKWSYCGGCGVTTGIVVAFKGARYSLWLKAANAISSPSSLSFLMAGMLLGAKRR